MDSTQSTVNNLLKNKLKDEKSKIIMIEFKNQNQTLSKKPQKSMQKGQKCFLDTSEASPFEQKVFRERDDGKGKDYDEEKDRRTSPTIDKSSDWPYCSIGKIKGFCNGKEFFGTGTLIGPKVVLTCAHNIYDLKAKTEHKNLEFFPSLNGGTYKDSSKVIKFRYPEEYKNYDYEDPNQFLHDYALLFLDENLDDNYGYLGIKNSTEDGSELEVSLYGYSGCTKGDKGKNLVGMEGPVVLKGSLYQYNRIDTYTGQSGSGLFRKEGEEYLIIGVHVGGAGDLNQAVKIDSERLLRIKAWTVIETDSQSLDLSYHQIGDEGMKHLSAIDLSKLWKLNLQSSKIGDEGMKHLLSMNLLQLQRLDIGSNQIGAEGIKHLSAMTLKELKELTLQNNRIGLEGMENLSKINLPQLQILVLFEMEIGDEGMKYLSKMNLPRLQKLYLWSNEIGDEGMKNLGPMKLPQLQELYLYKNKIGDEGMKHFSKMNLPQLQILNFKINQIGDEGMKHLSQMNLPQLQTLDLSYNQIGDEGIKNLSAMESPQLKRLYLTGNQIGDEGVKHLSAMNLPLLKELNIKYNLIEDEGRKELKSLKPNWKIEG